MAIGNVIHLDRSESGGGTGTGFLYSATNYTDLTTVVAPTANELDLAIVYNSQGVWPINRRLKGVYMYQSGTWEYANQELQDILSAKLDSVQAGTNVTIDNTDPLNPIINVSLPSSDVYLDTINGNLMPVYVDTGRSNKVLSSAKEMFSFGENNLADNDWITPAGNATNADSGHVMDEDKTVTAAAFTCEDDNGETKNLDLYINNAFVATLFTTDGSSGLNTDFDNALNIDVSQGDRLQMRAGDNGGGANDIEDTVVNIYLRGRKA